jgi:SAM-dependent methyltransferase
MRLADIDEKRAFFNGLAASWDEKGDDRKMDAGLRRFVQSSYAASAKTILDVGCGTGILVPHLLARYPNAQAIIELDYAEEMLAVNRSKFQNQRLIRVLADAANLPIPDNSIDLVLCFNVVPHLVNIEATFQSLLRVLVSGGMFAVGHLMSSDELNRFHGNLDGPVAHDRLPPAKELGSMLEGLGGVDIVAKEEPGRYFVQAWKAI